MFDAAGPDAQAIIQLWLVLFSVAAFVFCAVCGFAIYGYWRNRRRRQRPASEATISKGFVAGIAVTVLLLLIIFIATLKTSQPFAKEFYHQPASIEVIGKRWWWAVNYLDQEGKTLFQTANEIYIPVGVPVRIRLVSDNVIHSFWVPKLAGKVDMIPGRTNHITLQADRPGTFRGICAEYCGIQHALMAFLVIAESAEEYQKFLISNQAPAASDSQLSELALQGKKVFHEARCAECHSIRGVVEAKGAIVGPDLTHFATRKTIASATVPNRKGHLAGWIADPQGIKPGNLMPSVPLEAEEHHALLHYLESLQ